MPFTGIPNSHVPNISQFDINQSNERKSINRAQEVRRDTDHQKDISYGLIDIDTSIMRQLEKMEIGVVDNGERIKVPIFYSSPERFKSIRNDGYFRDTQGKIQVPAISFSRVSSEKNPALVTFNRYLKYTVMKRYSEKNRYTPFNILMGQNVPVNEIFGVTLPDQVILGYRFLIWTSYVEQMNKIVERLNFEAEDYWGEKRGFKFRVKIDSFSHTTQLQADQDRMVRTEFDLQAWGYLLPDIITTFDGPKDTTQKWLTVKKIIMKESVVDTRIHLPTESELNADKISSKYYPNIPQSEAVAGPGQIPNPNQPAEAPPILEPRRNPRLSAVILSPWTFPAPIQSSDRGAEGQISYDDEYYYIFVGNVWKRTPKIEVNSLSSVAGEVKWTSFDGDFIYLEGSIDKIPISLFNIF